MNNMLKSFAAKKIVGIMTAAGKGERLKSISKNLPKPLVKLNGQELIKYGISYMKNMKIQKIYIVANNKNKEDFLKATKNIKGIEIFYHFIEKSDSVMESLDYITNFIKKEDQNWRENNYLYWLADNVIIGEDFKEKVEEANKLLTLIKKPASCLFLKETNIPQSLITMNLDGSFTDKPKNPETNISAIGVFLHNYLMLEDTSERVKNPNVNEYTIWDCWISRHHLEKLMFEGKWYDIGTEESYNLFMKENHGYKIKI